MLFVKLDEDLELKRTLVAQPFSCKIRFNLFYEEGERTRNLVKPAVDSKYILMNIYFLLYILLIDQ